MIILLAWSLTGLAILLAGSLIALGIELNRRDYRERARAAETGGAVVSLQRELAEVEAAQLRAA
jgi:hypothetical protein